MRGVPVSGKRIAFVDDDCFELVKIHSWHLHGSWHLYGAAYAAGYINKRKKNCTMHRFLWEEKHGPIPDGYVIDHINGDGLDNQLSNLRVVTQAQNQQNRREYKWGKSKSELAQMRDPEKLRRYMR